MADDFNFWAIVIGVFGAFSLFAVAAELNDRRQHARYRRAQQDRVKARGVIDHFGGASK